MKKTHTVTQKASDIENFKEVMISFVSKALSLTQVEEQSLIKNSSELSQQSTLPDLITHLSKKGIEDNLVERLKEFGKNDAILANANSLITLKTS
ncbi:MAG: hypothetical protein JJV99_08260 [Colwellia sp.]|nr:hypothetical protein [Colwellia sp.]